MMERVSSADVAKAMDEILEKAGLKIPNRLHKVVAEQTGLHPTTVLRYHRQELESADARVLECVHDIGERLDRGESLFEECERDGEGYTGFPVHVCSHDIQRWFQRVLEQMEDPGPTPLYAWLADRLDTDETTVMRWHSGELGGAPVALLSHLRDLDRQLKMGEVVVFRRGNRNVVPRAAFCKLLEEVATLGILGEFVVDDVDDRQARRATDARLVHASVETQLGLEHGTIDDICSDPSWPFVDESLYEKLAALRDGAMYDPSHRYEIGERLYHHDLGAGSVVGKAHKDRILVEFHGGVRRYLRENVWMDPRWPFPQG